MSRRSIRFPALLTALLVLAGLSGCAAGGPSSSGPAAAPAFTHAATPAASAPPGTPSAGGPAATLPGSAALPEGTFPGGGQPQGTAPATPGGSGQPQGSAPAPGNGGQQLPVATVSGQPVDFGTADLTGAQAGLLEGLLAAWGFGCYTPDGLWQDDNVYELSLFQRWAGLTPTGQLTDDTREALRTAYARWGQNRIDRTPLALEGRYIAIDAAGQATPRYEAEAISPEQNSPVKLTTYRQTVGAATGVWDYERNLELALLLRDRLTALGARVLLTRSDNDADIAAVLRAKRINVEEVSAALLVRCGDTAGCAVVQPAERGYQTGALLAESQKLSRCLQAGLAYDDTLQSRALTSSDAVTGLNWSKAPVSLVEPGSVADAADDARLGDEAYRTALADALTDGLTDYFATVAAG